MEKDEWPSEGELFEGAVSPPARPAGAPASIVILANDAVLAARPATAIQLAHACYAAGYEAVFPAAWGDELVAGECLRALERSAVGDAAICCCPRAHTALEQLELDGNLDIVALVPPAVAAARYVRQLYASEDVELTFVGGCPAGADESIDVRFTPRAFFAMLLARGIEIEDQPVLFESVLPPDRRRFHSLPGGAPALPTSEGTHATTVLREVTPATVQDADPGTGVPRVVYDVAEAVGCLCAADRLLVRDLEPPRATIPVVEPLEGLHLYDSPPRARRRAVADRRDDAITEDTVDPRGDRAPDDGAVPDESPEPALAVSAPLPGLQATPNAEGELARAESGIEAAAQPGPQPGPQPHADRAAPSSSAAPVVEPVAAPPPPLESENTPARRRTADPKRSLSLPPSAPPWRWSSPSRRRTLLLIVLMAVSAGVGVGARRLLDAITTPRGATAGDSTANENGMSSAGPDSPARADSAPSFESDDSTRGFAPSSSDSAVPRQPLRDTLRVPGDSASTFSATQLPPDSLAAGSSRRGRRAVVPGWLPQGSRRWPESRAPARAESMRRVAPRTPDSLSSELFAAPNTRRERTAKRSSSSAT